MTNFLFFEYLNTFWDFYKISKGKAVFGQAKVRSFYTWEDQIYRNFMINVLLSLEPYMEDRKV